VGVRTRVADRTGSARRTLPATPTSVAEARLLVRDLLCAQGRADLVDTATLLVSELVTNSLLHAGTSVGLSAHVDRDGLLVEVADDSPHAPVRREYAATAGTGRGLRMLESLVDDWGVVRRGDGKTVWFRLTEDGSDLDAASPLIHDVGRKGYDEVADVVLLNVPLLLHGAWQEHSAALLREHLLASIDRGDPEQAIKVHAEATDAMAILAEQVPVAPLPVGPDGSIPAEEPGATAPRVDLQVPADSVAHFAILDSAVDDALEMARDGVLLTPPTQPEIQSFRIWVCQQVHEQVAGRAPTPWTGDGEHRASLFSTLVWDATTVQSSVEALVAVDDGNRIVALSRAACDLLGYDDSDELVGRRLLSLIPERLRQAHIAGFTLYFLDGRQPLLERPAVMPALRRDGSEVLVELRIHSQPADGREVFVAALRAARG